MLPVEGHLWNGAFLAPLPIAAPSAPEGQGIVQDIYGRGATVENGNISTLQIDIKPIIQNFLQKQIKVYFL